VGRFFLVFYALPSFRSERRKSDARRRFSLDLCDLKAYKGFWEVEYGEIVARARL
jgi:hypothetical protein